jgi:uncharacterized protein with PIN domain
MRDMDMKETKCPICSGNAKLIIKKGKKIFREEEFEIFEYFYRCTECKEEFTSKELDDVNVLQVYNLDHN